MQLLAATYSGMGWPRFHFSLITEVPFITTFAGAARHWRCKMPRAAYRKIISFMFNGMARLVQFRSAAHDFRYFEEDAKLRPGRRLHNALIL